MAGPLDELRTLASSAALPPPVMDAYLAKVRSRAYSVTDGDVEELTQAGVTEDEIFDSTVAVAIAEGLRRLDAAQRVIG